MSAASLPQHNAVSRHLGRAAIIIAITALVILAILFATGAGLEALKRQGIFDRVQQVTRTLAAAPDTAAFDRLVRNLPRSADGVFTVEVPYGDGAPGTYTNALSRGKNHVHFRVVFTSNAAKHAVNQTATSNYDPNRDGDTNRYIFSCEEPAAACTTKIDGSDPNYSPLTR